MSASWNVSIRFWFSSPTAVARCRLKIVFVARFEIQKSWRTSSAAGTVHHPSVRNNVFGYRLFNFQDSVNHSLCILIRRIFLIYQIALQAKIHSLHGFKCLYQLYNKSYHKSEKVWYNKYRSPLKTSTAHLRHRILELTYRYTFEGYLTWTMQFQTIRITICPTTAF